MAVKRCTQLDCRKVSQCIFDLALKINEWFKNEFIFLEINLFLFQLDTCLNPGLPSSPIISHHRPSQLRKTEYEGIETEKVEEIVVSYLS